jgi:hypothetical protein
MALIIDKPSKILKELSENVTEIGGEDYPGKRELFVRRGKEFAGSIEDFDERKFYTKLVEEVGGGEDPLSMQDIVKTFSLIDEAIGIGQRKGRRS